MFVRTRSQPGKEGPIEYAYLVSNEWNPFKKKHQQKILTSLGRVSELPENGMIEKMILALDKFANRIGMSSLSEGVILKDLSDEEVLSRSREWGVWQLAEQVIKQLGLDKILQRAWEKSDEKKSSSEQRRSVKVELPTQATSDVAQAGSVSRLLQTRKSKTGRRRLSLEKFQAVVTGIIAYRLYERTDASERSTHGWYREQVYLPDKVSTNKNDWYRSLDILLSNKDEIEQEYYLRNKTLFTQGLDLVLFDTTSIYYWGAKGRADENDLLQYGHSKDGKANLKQVMVGVLMTSAGEPVAHEVFAGNTADVHSFARVMDVVKEKYHLKRVIFIADRGMVSEQNLISLEQSGYEYILGIRMRKLPKGLREKLFQPVDPKKPYQDMEVAKRNPDGTVKLYSREFKVEKFTDQEIKDYFIDKIFKYKLKSTTFDQDKLLKQIRTRRIFVCLNPAEAAGTKEKRKFFKKIIQHKISNTATKEWVIKNGYRKYLKFEKELEPKLDTDRLEAEELFDGKWVVMTNRQSISPYLASKYYQTLQTIERGFRDLKSLITVQPIFHWKEDRIKAHIFVCFLSLIVKWYICKILDKDSQQTGRRFIETMIDLKAIEVTQKPAVYVRTAISPDTQKQMKQLKMKIPGKVIIDTRTRPVKPNPKGGRPKNRPAKNQLAFFKNK